MLWVIWFLTDQSDTSVGVYDIEDKHIATKQFQTRVTFGIPHKEVIVKLWYEFVDLQTLYWIGYHLDWSIQEFWRVVHFKSVDIECSLA